MEVPTDYVMQMMEKTIDSKITALSEKINSNHQDIKTDIVELKTQIKDFSAACKTGMECMDKRVKTLEEVKFKVFAYSGAVALVAGVATKYILS